MKVKLAAIIRIAISLALLALLLYFMRGNYDDILTELKQTNLLIFFIAFLLYCATVIFVTFRLEILLVGENIKMPILKLIELNYIGYFFNNIMPSAVGGDIVKAYYTGLLTKEKAKSYVSIFMDRIIGVFSFALIGLVALLFCRNNITSPSIKKSVLIFAGLCVLFALISLNAKIGKFVLKIFSKVRFMNIGDKLSKAYKLLYNYRNKKEVLLKAFFMSVAIQILYFIVIYALFKAVNIGISFNLVLLIMPIVSIISMLPSIGGLGIREGAFVALFGPLVGSERAFGISILLLAILFLTSIIGGIIYLSSPQFRGVKIKINNSRIT